MLFDFKKNRVWAENLVLVSQLGLTMAGSIVFCFFVGLYLDKWLGTKGLFVVLSILAGVVGGGVTVYRRITDVTKSKSQSRKTLDDDVG